MFSSLRFKGTLSQIMHAAYPIVCFPVLVHTFLSSRFFFVVFFHTNKRLLIFDMLSMHND